MKNLKSILAIVGVVLLFIVSSAFAISYIGVTKPFGTLTSLETVAMGSMHGFVVTVAIVALISYERAVISDRKYKRSGLYRLIQGNLQLTNKHA